MIIIMEKYLKAIFNIKLIILFLLILPFNANAEIKITAKKGDTLFKLSKQYQVPLKELMHKNNINNANNLLEGKIIIIPSNRSSKKNNSFTYKVIKGDTIYKIARQFSVKTKDIISLNNLEDYSYLHIDQLLSIPKAIESIKEVNIKKPIRASKKVFFHQKSNGENLSYIAHLHNIPLDELVSLNKLNDPKKIDLINKLKIRQTNINKWFKYGSLNIHWSDWRYLDGNYITKVKNKNNRPFLLAINCRRRTMNNTIMNSTWRNWYFPKRNFEHKLIIDFCDQDFKI